VNIVIIINKIALVDIVYHHHQVQQQQQNENQVMIQMVAIQNEGNRCFSFRITREYNFHIFFYSKTKTTQEKSSLPDTNRFTSPITAFRRKKKTPGNSNDPGKYIIILLFEFIIHL